MKLVFAVSFLFLCSTPSHAFIERPTVDWSKGPYAHAKIEMVRDFSFCETKEQCEIEAKRLGGRIDMIDGRPAVWFDKLSVTNNVTDFKMENDR